MISEIKLPTDIKIVAPPVRFEDIPSVADDPGFQEARTRLDSIRRQIEEVNREIQIIQEARRPETKADKDAAIVAALASGTDIRDVTIGDDETKENLATLYKRRSLLQQAEPHAAANLREAWHAANQASNVRLKDYAAWWYASVEKALSALIHLTAHEAKMIEDLRIDKSVKADWSRTRINIGRLVEKHGEVVEEARKLGDEQAETFDGTAVVFHDRTGQVIGFPAWVG